MNIGRFSSVVRWMPDLATSRPVKPGGGDGSGVAKIPTDEVGDGMGVQLGGSVGRTLVISAVAEASAATLVGLAVAACVAPGVTSSAVGVEVVLSPLGRIATTSSKSTTGIPTSSAII